MRRLVRLIVFTGIVVAACGGGTAPPSPAAPTPAAASATPLTRISVKPAYTNLTGDSLPIWTAMDAGIFTKNGLTVDLQSINGGSQGMAALLAGSVEIISVGGAESLSATASGGKITVTAILTPVFPYLLMAAPDIKTAADLQGKKIGISSPGGGADIAKRQGRKTGGPG